MTMRYATCFRAVLAVLFLITILLVATNVQHLGSKLSSTDKIRLENYEQMVMRKENTDLPCCKWDENLLVGRLRVDQTPADWKEIRKSSKSFSVVKEGGHWRPQECQAKTKVAIIIPLRNREKHLTVLLRHLHPVLQRQKLDYRIFVISQVDHYPFNKAKLLNVGFVESIKYDDYDCFVFHDVDLIPEDDRNDYGCPSGPRHMCPAVSKFNYNLFSPYLFGGVTAFTRRDFLKVNGYPNRYYGWGAEDDDMYYRVKARGFNIVRPPLETGRYTMIKHKDEERNSKAKQLLTNAADYIDKDGLTTLKYGVETKTYYELYTQIDINVLMTEDEKLLTSLKEKS